MFPLIFLAAPAIFETLAIAAATATVVTVASRATSDVYDKATKKEDDKD